jgi:PAS domain S-box-containing protein
MAKRRDLSSTMRIDLPPEALDKPEEAPPAPVSPTKRYVRLRARRIPESAAAPRLGDDDFQQLFESVYDACLIADLEGRIINANVRAIQFFEFERDEFLGHPIVGFLSGAEETLIGTICETLRKDRFVLLQAYCIRKDKTLFPAEISTNLLRLSGRDYLCFFIRDVTQRVRAQEERDSTLVELQRSNADLQEFAYVVSHDLQEPLRKITTFGEMLKTRSGDSLPPDGNDCVERMQKAAARMQGQIEALLSLSRVTTNAKPFAPVDLNTIVRAVLSDLEFRIRDTGADVRVGELPTIDAEPFQMGQLLQNLIANALKFRKKDTPPVIKIRAMPGSLDDEDDEKCCRIIVEDNGIGLDPRQEDRIFGIFQRLHTRNEYEGTGIGLAVCKKIAERHGGSIRASGEPGGGTVFTVALPVRQRQEA